MRISQVWRILALGDTGKELAARLQVTNENKREYVDLVAEHRMTTAIRAQTQSFLKGYWEMVPKVQPHI